MNVFNTHLRSLEIGFKCMKLQNPPRVHSLGGICVCVCVYCTRVCLRVCVCEGNEIKTKY